MDDTDRIGLASAMSPAATADTVDGALTALGLLERQGLTCAPHVAAALAVGYGGDATAVVQAAAWLTAAQRRGWAALPDPLPCVAAVADACAPLMRLDAASRRLLLLQSVSTTDSTELLLCAAGIDVDELVSGPAAALLLLVAGHVTFADSRTRSWVHETATIGERTAAHDTLADAATRLGDADDALWHRSLARLGGDPAAAGPLVDLAERLDAAGESLTAFAVAREAVAHARGDLRPVAREAAGRTATHAGLLDEARRFGATAAAAVDVPEATPLGRARRALGDAVDLARDGRLLQARARLTAAALTLPVAVADRDGLASRLAARLALLVDGDEDALTRALAVADGSGVRRRDVEERALAAELAGEHADAEALAALAAERDGALVRLPGFDLGASASLIADDDPDAGDVGVARRARLLISRTDDTRFADDRAIAQELTRGIRSPYERALTEYVIGLAGLRHCVPACARRHLVASAHLFREAGAAAWLPRVDVLLPPATTVLVGASDSGAARSPAAGPHAEARGDIRWTTDLTDREREVAELVVTGATNREVATALHVSVRTVEVHLGRVFGKLGVHSRVELTVVVLRDEAGR